MTSDAGEVDWDDILPGADNDNSDDGGAVAVAPIRQHADQMQLAIICPTPTKFSVRVQPSKWKVEIPAPLDRTRTEECLAASRMRDAKARVRRSVEKEKNAKLISSALSKLRQSGMLKDHNKTRLAIRKDGLLTLTLPDTVTTKLPYQAVQFIAYSKLKSQAVVAIAFGLKTKTVRKLRKLVAHVAEETDDKHRYRQADRFKIAPPQVFVSTMSYDATSDEFILPMLGFEEAQLRQLCRSQWHILVSIQGFSWCCGSEADDAYSKADFVRSNIALQGTETSETVHEALYDMPQISSYEEFERAGLLHATDYAMCHFDFDGHSANPGVTVLRRETILKSFAALHGDDSDKLIPLFSVRHCGCHLASLVEADTRGVIKTETVDHYAWMGTAVAFSEWAGHFSGWFTCCRYI